MPIYEYRAASEQGCPLCQNGFDRLQKMADEPLQKCPDCNNPVKRVISPPNLASSGPSLKEDNLEKHDFTQYRKVEKGVYEKTAGKGPGFISDKD